MITTAEEYLQSLWKINDGNIPTRAILLPSDETIYEIDLNTRIIKAPKFLSVQKDHASETIYFLVDRMFGETDLSTTSCLIQYINADGIGGFQIVPFYDITTFSSQVVNDYIKTYVTAETYQPNKYYIYKDNEYVLDSSGFEINQTYYIFNDASLNKRFTKANVNINNYKPGHFYYLDNEDLQYKLAIGAFDSEEVYYVSIEKKYIKANIEYSNYQKNVYYFLNENNEMILSTSEYDKDKEYYSLIDKPKMLFPWTVDSRLTAASGAVKYSVRFFKVDTIKNKIVYDLNTQPAQTQILPSLDIEIEDEDFNKEIEASPSILEEIYQLINASKQDLCWIEA